MTDNERELCGKLLDKGQVLYHDSGMIDDIKVNVWLVSYEDYHYMVVKHNDEYYHIVNFGNV